MPFLSSVGSLWYFWIYQSKNGPKCLDTKYIEYGIFHITLRWCTPNQNKMLSSNFQIFQNNIFKIYRRKSLESHKKLEFSFNFKFFVEICFQKYYEDYHTLYSFTCLRSGSFFALVYTKVPKASHKRYRSGEFYLGVPFSQTF